MAETTSNTTVRNTSDTSHTLISINTAAQTPLKFKSSNYLSWKLQFQTLFIGYDLKGYIDGTTPCPPATITQGDQTITNPAHHAWIRQDQLILNAIIGSITPSLIPFIAQAETAKQAWMILANTYAKPSRGRVKQLKLQLKNTTKGSLGISEFMQVIKTRADDLALLGAPMDNEEITDKILEGLNDDYKELVRAVQARDTSITFDETEIFSFSFGGSNDNLLAAGAKSQILFWDWRNGKQVACLEESHIEDVTQVHFVPDNRNKLLSASVDGLMCIFNTDGDINDDDDLELVINVGTSIGKVGFFGETYQKLWCLTHIESLSIWDWKDSRNEANLLEARSLASDSWTLDHVDYFVDCHYPGEGDRLWLIGGTNAGALGYFPVNYKGVRAIGSPEAILGGGHKGIVRSVLPMSCLKGGPSQSQGIFAWTGGEDGRLCCWLSDDSTEINRSWISSALGMKSQKSRKKKRRNPY